VLLSGAFGYGGSVAVAERRYHPDQRHPRSSAGRRRARAGRGHRRALQHSVARPVAWLGFAVSLAGVA